MWRELASPWCSNTLVRPSISLHWITLLGGGGGACLSWMWRVILYRKARSLNLTVVCIKKRKKRSRNSEVFPGIKVFVGLWERHSVLHKLRVEIQRRVLKGYPQTAGCIKKSHQLLCFSGRRWGLDPGSGGGGGEGGRGWGAAVLLPGIDFWIALPGTAAPD